MARVYFSIASWNLPALKAVFPFSFSCSACVLGSLSDVEGSDGGCSVRGGCGSGVSTGIASSWLVALFQRLQPYKVQGTYSEVVAPLVAAAVAALAVCCFFFCCCFFLLFAMV